MYFLKDFIYLFLEREEGKEKEREGNPSMCGCLSHAPPTGDWSTNRWPFGLQAGCSAHWAIPARALCGILYGNSIVRKIALAVLAAYYYYYYYYYYYFIIFTQFEQPDTLQLLLFKHETICLFIVIAFRIYVKEQIEAKEREKCKELIPPLLPQSYSHIYYTLARTEQKEHE